MIKNDFEKNGYVLIKDALDPKKIDDFMKKHLELVNKITNGNFTDTNDPNLIKFYDENPEIETTVYNSQNGTSLMMEFAKQKEIIEPVKKF
jgi:hypothetical protein